MDLCTLWTALEIVALHASYHHLDHPMPRGARSVIVGLRLVDFCVEYMRSVFLVVIMRYSQHRSWLEPLL